MRENPQCLTNTVKHKLTIVIAVMEALVLLTMKLMDWKESKTYKPTAGKARKVKGHPVVNPTTAAYDEESPEGESSAINILAGSSAADEKIHEED